MTPGSYTTWRSPRVNFLANIPGKQNELAGALSNAASDKTPTPPKASTSSLVPPLAKNLFTKFMKMFMEMTNAQALVEP